MKNDVSDTKESAIIHGDEEAALAMMQTVLPMTETQEAVILGILRALTQRAKENRRKPGIQLSEEQAANIAKAIVGKLAR